MQSYDFKSLNDKEFEVLCTDLLSIHIGVRFERFKPGRDQGVDGRFFSPGGREAVLQCKHWISTPINQLIKHLKNSELSKIKKIEPDRYLLATSKQLSRTEKTKIKEALHPYIESESDIFGQEDLNDFLSQNPEIEKKHYKLWITSSTVLQHILNKAALDRSNSSLAQIKEICKLYVQTSNHDRALDKINDLGVVIITGEPGIGKTTLAEHICFIYSSNGYEYIKISEEIKEAESIYEKDKKQIFYFDDFLGRNYLEALSGHEGSHIVNFIKRISLEKTNKAFVLTSRSTILNQGKLLIDLFKNNNIEKTEYELSANLFKEIDKAKILYNHIWHSELPNELTETYFANRNYRKIISHRNFNPRLISFILDKEKTLAIGPDEYWDHVNTSLNNPTDVWDNPFTAQQDDFSRAIVLLVTLNGKAIRDIELSEIFDRHVNSPDNTGLKGRRDYISNIKHLTGSLLNRKISNKEGEASLDLFNPSLGDYVLRRYKNDIPTLRSAFKSLRSPSSLNTLRNLAANDIIDTKTHTSIIDQLIKNASLYEFDGFTLEYLSKLLLSRDSYLYNKMDPISRKAIKHILNNSDAIEDSNSIRLLKLTVESRITDPKKAYELLIKLCDNCSYNNEEEILEIFSLYNSTNYILEASEVVRCHLEDLALTYLEENIYDIFPDSDVFSNVDPGDATSATTNLKELAETKILELGLAWKLNPERVLNAFDIHWRMDSYFMENSSHEDIIRPQQLNYIDEVDDLFSRN